MSSYRSVKVCVKNLEDVIDNKRLFMEFSSFGEVTNAEVITKNGQSKGYGYVSFTSPEEARRAIAVMNGRVLVSKQLYVTLVQKRESKHDSNQLPKKNIQLGQNALHHQIPPTIPLNQTNYLQDCGQNCVSQDSPVNLPQVTCLSNSESDENLTTGPNIVHPNTESTVYNPPIYNHYGTEECVGNGQLESAGFQTVQEKSGPVKPFPQLSEPTKLQYPLSSNMFIQLTPRPILPPAFGIRNDNGLNHVSPRPKENAMHLRPSFPPPFTPQNNNYGKLMHDTPYPENNAYIEYNLPRGSIIQTNNSNMEQYSIVNKQNGHGKDPKKQYHTKSYTELENNNDQRQNKQFLGQSLYPFVKEICPNFARKITEMLLEMENEDLMFLLKSKESLKDKVEEAAVVLRSSVNRKNKNNMHTVTDSEKHARKTKRYPQNRRKLQNEQEDNRCEMTNHDIQIEKQKFGENLYPLICDINPDFAGEITGILLKRDNIELSKMLESRELLQTKVNEVLDEMNVSNLNL